MYAFFLVYEAVCAAHFFESFESFESSVGLSTVSPSAPLQYPFRSGP